MEVFLSGSLGSVQTIQTAKCFRGDVTTFPEFSDNGKAGNQRVQH
jgi:hypothetical protein